MKVKVEYTEIQAITLTREVEMTKKQYQEYERTGQLPEELSEDLHSNCSIDSACDYDLEKIIIEATPIK